MEYRQFEEALAHLHGVKPEQVKAFRARLRVLRDMGVPHVPKSGKGTRAEYRLDQVWETHLALRLAEFGLPPLRVTQAVKTARLLSVLKRVRAWNDQVVYDQEVPPDEGTSALDYGAPDGSDLWIVIGLSGSVGKATETIFDIAVTYNFGRLTDLVAWLSTEGTSGVRALINLSALTREFDSLKMKEKG